MKFRRSDFGLFFILLFSTAYFHHPVGYDNTSSRYFLLSAMVDHGRLDIDMYRGLTIDVSITDRHHYSNKAIGASVVAAPVYGFLRRFTPIRMDLPLSRRAQYLTRVVTTSVPFALVGVVLFRLLLAWGAMPEGALAATLGYAFGTIAWIHASLFSGHQMAANFGFLSFALVWMCSRREIPAAGAWGCLAGFLAGLSALADYTAAGIAASLTVYAWIAIPRLPDRLGFLAGLVLAVSPLAVYNSFCFGSPWTFSYAPAHLGYSAFAEGARKGLMGVGLPSLESLQGLLISPARGLFFVMPIFLMALAGFWVLRKNRDLRKEVILISACVLGTVFIASGFYGWHGGWTFGPRYLTPMLPFLILPAAFAYDRVWFLILLILSAAQIGLAQIAMPHVPEEIRNPVLECIYPMLRYGYLSQTAGGYFGIQASLSILAWAGLLGWMLRVLWLWIRNDVVQNSASDRPDIPVGLRRWRPVYAIAAASILAGLWVTRTEDPQRLHSLRARLLEPAAIVLKSEDLARAMYAELYLSNSGQSESPEGS